jgi:hypothetical protein
VIFFMQSPMDSLLGLNCVVQDVVLSRFLKVKYLVLETGCGWLPGWMNRADSKYGIFFTTRMHKWRRRIFP